MQFNCTIQQPSAVQDKKRPQSPSFADAAKWVFTWTDLQKIMLISLGLIQQKIFMIYGVLIFMECLA